MAIKKTHRNDCEQSTNRSTSEGGGRDKLKNVDGDFPACMRLKKESIEDHTKKQRPERKRRRTTQVLQC